MYTSSEGNRYTRDNRLPNAAAFGRVFDRARRSRDEMFTVLCRGNGGEAARLGLAISKKHCRRATARNRIKRAVRESFRTAKAELAGLDVVVMNRPAATTASTARLRASLDVHWQRCRQLAAKQEEA